MIRGKINTILTNGKYTPYNLSVDSGNASNNIPHANATGIDTYSTTITGISSYADGDAYLIRFINGNTTQSSLNINSLGAITLYRNNDGVLIGGDIWAGAEMICIYNSTINGFQCIGTSPNSLFSYVTNVDSVTITKGQAVYAFGGTGDRMSVKRAFNTSDATSAQTVGIVLSNSIAANQKGIIIMQGLLDKLSILPTSTYADGDPIYLGATAGTITNVKPYAPNHLVYLGVVTTASNGNAGRMYVRIQNGYELDELHNVQAQTPSLKDTLWYDNTVSPAQWKTASIPTILGYTPVTNARTISTTSPLTGGGDLSADRTLAINQATTTNDGYLSFTDWNTFNNKQASLVSGTNIKTVNSNSLLGSGNVAVQDTLVSGTNIKTVNSNSLLGSGNLVITTTISNGTVATMLASSPSAGTIFYCTDFLIGFHQYDGTSWEYLAPTQSEIFFQNFAMGYSQSQTNNFVRAVSGAGAFGDRNYEQTGETKSGTFYYLLTGTTTTGFSQLAGVGNGIGGSPTKLIAFLARVKIPVLSTVSQEFIARIGHPTAGINLTYDRLNRGTSLRLSAGGTFYDTGYVLDTNYHEYVILVDLSALTARVYVDKILVFTQTGLSISLRSNTTLFNGFRIDKSAGTTGVNLNIDYTGAWCYKN